MPAIPPLRRKLVAGVATLVALAGMSSAAQADVSALPVGGQLASAEFPLDCKFPVVGYQTLHFRITGSAPAEVTVGQKFSINDISATVLVPEGLIQFIAGLLNTRTINVDVTKLPLTAVGLTPGSMNALTDTLTRNGLVLDPGSTLLVDVPESGFVDSPSFQARRAGEASITIGLPEATIHLKGAKGNPTFIPLTLNCKAAQPAARWMGIRVLSASSGGAAEVHAGVRSTALSGQAADAQYVATHTVRACTFGSLGRRQVDEFTSGVSPRGVPGGDSFSISERRGEWHLPASLVNELLALYPGAASMQGTLGSLSFTASGAMPSTMDMAVLQPLSTSLTALSPSTAAVMSYPYDGGLSVGPFTAGTRGSSIAMGGGALSGSLQFSTQSGVSVGAALPLSCEAPQDAPILNSLSRE